MRKFNVVPGLFAGLVLLSVPALSSAGVFLSVHIAPPALEVYAQPMCPTDGYIWTPGYWPKDPVFSRDSIQTIPLVDGPRFPEDSLREMHRVLNIEALYKTPLLFHAAPWLLNPSSMKLLLCDPVKEFWGEIARDGLANLGMAIIGYSLPSHDDYARQVIYRMVKKYQSLHWQEISGQKKTPLVFIDYRSSESERVGLKQRYKFVDWDRTLCRFSGFNEDDLPVLFPTLD